MKPAATSITKPQMKTAVSFVIQNANPIWNAGDIVLHQYRILSKRANLIRKRLKKPMNSPTLSNILSPGKFKIKSEDDVADCTVYEADLFGHSSAHDEMKHWPVKELYSTITKNKENSKSSIIQSFSSVISKQSEQSPVSKPNSHNNQPQLEEKWHHQQNLEQKNQAQHISEKKSSNNEDAHLSTVEASSWISYSNSFDPRLQFNGLVDVIAPQRQHTDRSVVRNKCDMFSKKDLDPHQQFNSSPWRMTHPSFYLDEYHQFMKALQQPIKQDGMHNIISEKYKALLNMNMKTVQAAPIQLLPFRDKNVSTLDYYKLKLRLNSPNIKNLWLSENASRSELVEHPNGQQSNMLTNDNNQPPQSARSRQTCKATYAQVLADVQQLNIKMQEQCQQSKPEQLKDIEETLVHDAHSENVIAKSKNATCTTFSEDSYKAKSTSSIMQFAFDTSSDEDLDMPEELEPDYHRSPFLNENFKNREQEILRLLDERDHSTSLPIPKLAQQEFNNHPQMCSRIISSYKCTNDTQRNSTASKKKKFTKTKHNASINQRNQNSRFSKSSDSAEDNTYAPSRPRNSHSETSQVMNKTPQSGFVQSTSLLDLHSHQEIMKTGLVQNYKTNELSAIQDGSIKSRRSTKKARSHTNLNAFQTRSISQESKVYINTQWHPQYFGHIIYANPVTPVVVPLINPTATKSTTAMVQNIHYPLNYQPYYHSYSTVPNTCAVTLTPRRSYERQSCWQQANCIWASQPKATMNGNMAGQSNATQSESKNALIIQQRHWQKDKQSPVVCNYTETSKVLPVTYISQKHGDESMPTRTVPTLQTYQHQESDQKHSNQKCITTGLANMNATMFKIKTTESEPQISTKLDPDVSISENADKNKEFSLQWIKKHPSMETIGCTNTLQVSTDKQPLLKASCQQEVISIDQETMASMELNNVDFNSSKKATPSSLATMETMGFKMNVTESQPLIPKYCQRKLSISTDSDKNLNSNMLQNEVPKKLGTMRLMGVSSKMEDTTSSENLLKRNCQLEVSLGDQHKTCIEPSTIHRNLPDYTESMRKTATPVRGAQSFNLLKQYSILQEKSSCDRTPLIKFSKLKHISEANDVKTVGNTKESPASPKEKSSKSNRRESINTSNTPSRDSDWIKLATTW